MDSHPSLRTLASRLNLLKKIDPFEDDPRYYEAWYNKLTEFEELLGKCPKKSSFDKLDLKTCDPKLYYDTSKAISDVTGKIHKDYDLSEFRMYVDYATECSEKISEILRTQKVTNNPNGGRVVSKTVYIVDVDYENMNDGTNVLLYCRDVESFETFTLIYRYDDYFYVKINDEITRELIEKKMKGYEWYLRENRYNAPNNYGDPRQNSTNINTFPLSEGGVQYFKHTELVEDHKSIYGYRPHNDKFLKITASYANASVDFFKGMSKKNNWEFFEADLNYACKFLCDLDISACCAIDFEGTVFNKNAMTTCDNLVKCSHIKKNTVVPSYAPIMYYWDIECLSLQQDVFPTADLCPVIQISYLVTSGQTELERKVLCLRQTPGDSIYESYDTEEQLLIRFAQTILQWNPDAIAGFNSNNFDMPYIIDRMNVLGIYDFASCFTRRRGFKMNYKKVLKQSKQFGTKEVTKYTTPGFVMFDFFETIKADVTKKLRSYSLKSICSEYLKDDNKEELRYKDIPILFETPEGRAKIASYCMKDTALLVDLDKVLSLGTNCWGMAKVLGTTPDVVLNRGLVFKLVCKLKEYTTKFKLLMPSFTDLTKPKFNGKFEGAFVLEPEVGYHEDPVVTLDFASLYPSLMIAYNLSYETLVLNKKWIEEHPENFEQHCGEWYVKRSVYEGVIPSLEKDLGKVRSKAKKDRDKFEYGSDEYKNYESLQLAAKVIMNSLYGMLGSPTATVPMVQVAKTITGLGRENLLMAKNYVEKHYVDIIKKECPEDFEDGRELENCRVIYGDSVLGTTPVIFKHNDDVDVDNIRNLCLRYGDGNWMPVEGTDKEALNLVTGVYSWTENGWTSIERVIRHLCGKDMVTVETHTGFVTCTTDHSLIGSDKKELTPNDIVIGKTELLQNNPRGNDVSYYKTLHIPMGRVIDNNEMSFNTIEEAALYYKKTNIQIYSMINSKKSALTWRDYIAEVIIDESMAKIMGMFMGDGSCGMYDTKHGMKYTWAINNSDMKLIDKYKKLLNDKLDYLEFNCLDTIKSSGVYKLVAQQRYNTRGAVSSFTTFWREMAYYENGEKRIPLVIFNSPINVQKAFIEGLYDSDGTKNSKEFEISQKGERACHGIASILYMTGVPNVVIGGRSDKPGIYRLRVRTYPRKQCNVVKSVTDYIHLGYVYDLTTSNHHFQAGVGNIIVHNTDSIFIKTPGVTIDKAIKYGQILDKYTQKYVFNDRPPMQLEYEKVFWPLALIKKKGYVGTKYEFDPTKFKVAVMGIQLVRRDSAQLCIDVLQDFVDQVFKYKNKTLAAEHVKEHIANLYSENLPLEKFVITKKISKAEYVNSPGHIEAWKRMILRVGKDDAPAIGERFEYVVTVRNKKDGMKNCIMDYELAKEQRHVAIDKKYYFDTFIHNPIAKLLELIIGKKEADVILNPNNYSRTETMVAKRGNLLAFFGKDMIVNKKRKLN